MEIKDWVFSASSAYSNNYLPGSVVDVSNVPRWCTKTTNPGSPDGSCWFRMDGSGVGNITRLVIYFGYEQVTRSQRYMRFEKITNISQSKVIDVRARTSNIWPTVGIPASTGSSVIRQVAVADLELF